MNENYEENYFESIVYLLDKGKDDMLTVETYIDEIEDNGYTVESFIQEILQ